MPTVTEAFSLARYVGQRGFSSTHSTPFKTHLSQYDDQSIEFKTRYENNETMYYAAADILVSSGLRDAGYDTVLVTCAGWERDATTGKLRENAEVWPRGCVCAVWRVTQSAGIYGCPRLCPIFPYPQRPLTETSTQPLTKHTRSSETGMQVQSLRRLPARPQAEDWGSWNAHS
jgi:hypothetical protein